MFSGTVIGLTALGLSGDAFAASLARGAMTSKANVRHALKNGLVFGGTEGAMCMAGWLLAASLSGLISTLDHWIAVILLSAIGGKMIAESLSKDHHSDAPARATSGLGMTCLTAVGTSVDSAVIGVAMNFSGVPLSVALLIGAVSATLSTLGFLLGPMTGHLLGKRAELVGGAILVFIGVWIWCQHMFF